MKTYANFIATRRESSDLGADLEKIMIGRLAGYIYFEGFWIAEESPGNYYLLINQKKYHDTDLNKVEHTLWGRLVCNEVNGFDIQPLNRIYQHWRIDEHLPALTADEMVLISDLTQGQQAFLFEFRPHFEIASGSCHV